MNDVLYWKNLIIHMLQIFQGLFLATTTWDFFLTVIVNSHRSLVFSGLASGTATFIILPWITAIFVLAFILFSFYARDETPRLTRRVNIEYGIFIVIYGILAVLAVMNPVITWPVVMNYIVNIIWAVVLIYFRTIIINHINE